MSYPVCPTCKKPVSVRTSKRVGSSYEQRHYCGCGFKATRVVPAVEVLVRKPHTTRIEL